MGAEAVEEGTRKYESAAAHGAGRIASVDLLRGLVMIVMTLDHVRIYFSPFPWDPTDLSQASPGLFLTRWITHFCAPVFVFLAGTSAYLYRRNTGCTIGRLQGFLVTRGLWLVLLELTWVSFIWQFDYDGVVLQTIWALGCSMVALALLLYLPLPALLAVGLVMIFGHNLFDGIHARDLGAYGPLWSVLHEPGIERPTPDLSIDIVYPLVPWIGVMAVGYCFGRLLEVERRKRDAALITLGASMIVLFLVLRLTDAYGDPTPWATSPRGPGYTVLQVLNTTKYPASLQFLLMTLGTALLLIPLLERWRGALASAVSVYGRVPFFYYVLHLPLIHAVAVVWTHSAFGSDAPSLLPTYLVWVAVVLAMYPACRWYANYKARNKSKWWLSYL